MKRVTSILFEFSRADNAAILWVLSAVAGLLIAGAPVGMIGNAVGAALLVILGVSVSCFRPNSIREPLNNCRFVVALDARSRKDTVIGLHVRF